MLRAVVLNRAAPSERDIVRAYIRRASIGWGPEPRGRASSRALSLWPMPVGPQREKKAPTKRIEWAGGGRCFAREKRVSAADERAHPRYKISPPLRGTVAMSAEGVWREGPIAEEDGQPEGHGSLAEAAETPSLLSPAVERQSAGGSTSGEASTSEEGSSVQSEGVVRRAARWVWNALSPKPVLSRGDRRRSQPPPVDFGSPALRAALARGL